MQTSDRIRDQYNQTMGAKLLHSAALVRLRPSLAPPRLGRGTMVNHWMVNQVLWCFEISHKAGNK